MCVFTVMGRIRLKMLCSNMMEHPFCYLSAPFIAPWYRLRLGWELMRKRLPHRKSAWEKYRESIYTDKEEDPYAEHEER